jgi:VIT1/CCC1 family predicted Fe2+/Mn2+ transporter
MNDDKQISLLNSELERVDFFKKLLSENINRGGITLAVFGGFVCGAIINIILLYFLRDYCTAFLSMHVIMGCVIIYSILKMFDIDRKRVNIVKSLYESQVRYYKLSGIVDFD